MTSYRRIESVRKALEILEFLAHRKEPATAKELSVAVNIPEGTTMCHLVTMEDARFVRRVGDGYEVGMNAALVWARKKTLLESERDRVDRDLAKLTTGGME